MKMIKTLSGLVLALALCACDFDGGTEQGRCVAYDAEKGTVKMVVDTTLDQLNPHYSGKIDTFQLPTDPRDMGPAPVDGGRLMLEIDKNMVLYYDPADNKIKEMPGTYVDVEKNINAKHPKLNGKTFPIIDKEKGTVTMYSPRLQALVTFKPADPAALDLPVYTWRAGDEVRIAFRKDKPNVAIRFMNVTKTSIFSR